MVRKTRNEPEVEEKVVETAPVEAKVEVEEPSESTVVGVYQAGELIREYSLEVHGKNFKKLAVEFASKRHGYQLR